MHDETIKKILSALGFDPQRDGLTTAYKVEYQHIQKELEALYPLIKNRVLYKVLDMSNEDEAQFLREKILLGASVNQFLGDVQKVIICATTLGYQVDQRIRLAGITNMSTAILLDTAAMVIIEAQLDQWMTSLNETEVLKGTYLSQRYSPGYGDMPLSVQHAILGALDTAKSIGLTITASEILLPKKSVTAVIGIYDKPFKNTYSNCDGCLIRGKCKERERGNYCGY